MDIRIGVIDNPREISVALGDDADHDTVKASIDAALKGESQTLWLVDDRGREVGVASARIAYVEMVPEGASPIGFG